MAKAAPSIIERFNALPRAIQWAVYAAAGMIALLVWAEIVGPVKGRLDQKADAIQRDIRMVRAAADLPDEFRRVRPVVVSMGPIERPEPEASSDGQAWEVVDAILRDYSVEGTGWALHSRGHMPARALGVDVTDNPNYELARRGATLDFQADTETTMAILSRFESAPEIENVSVLNINRMSGRMLNVHLELEMWVLTPATRRGAR